MNSRPPAGTAGVPNFNLSMYPSRKSLFGPGEFFTRNKTNPLQTMDNDEGDIGTVRNIKENSWVPKNLRVDVGRSSAGNPLTLRGLASPSAPDFTNGTIVGVKINQPMHHVRSLPFLTRPIIATSSADIPPLDMEKLALVRRWILGIAVVDFDLDLGPVLSCFYPSLDIPPECGENIAFSSFPDSSTFETGSQVHSFKLTGIGKENMPSPVAYGNAYFTQQKDSTSKRGYLQRSVVIFSRHPFPSLYEELVSILGPMHLSQGNTVLESACNDISRWPDPSQEIELSVSFLGQTLQLQLPRTDDESQFQDNSKVLSSHSHIFASLPSASPSPLALFSAFLPSMWSIWELLILCEPILVFGPNPRLTSLTIWWLRDLFRPIPFAGDARPYITIHDRDYTTLINKNPPKSGVIVGITNPLILSVTRHWPHMLTLAGASKKELSHNGKGRPSHDHTGSCPIPGFSSQTHKRYTSKDRPLLKMWEDALSTSGMTASHELRRHFSSRTASFLAPLNRYINSLIPTPAETCTQSTLKRKLRLKPFNPVDFMKSLKTYGTPLPFRNSTTQREFYQRWLRTPAFGLWLTRQEEIVTGVLEENEARGRLNPT